MSDRCRVWVYGSLLSVDSLRTTLAPGARPRSMEPLTVTGWRRSWSCLSRRTFLDASGQRVRRVVLGIDPAEGATTDGVVLDLGADDLGRLRMRERAYDEIDLGGVTTFVPRPEHHRDRTDPGYPLVIERAYFETCVRGAREHGLDGVADELERTADLPLVEPAGGVRIDELTG